MGKFLLETPYDPELILLLVSIASIEINSPIIKLTAKGWVLIFVSFLQLKLSRLKIIGFASKENIYKLGNVLIISRL